LTFFLEIYFHFLKHELVVHDTGGDDNYEQFRSFSYSNTNVVLMCFSVDRPVSATNIIEKWIPEIKRFCGQCSIILIACKIDLRSDPDTIQKLIRDGENSVTSEDGRRIAASINADAYLECSAKTGEGVQDLFTHTARLSSKQDSSRKGYTQCILQ
jgi:Ras family protein A